VGADSPIETTVLAVEIGGWRMSPDEAAATVVALAGADPACTGHPWTPPTTP
jgi:hypothetical protein